jgi:predicted O-linked N-acetylglucosamine transferase (SPINDLY family)
VFARKPAPIQISYVGYPGPTGIQEIHYRLTDLFADPSDSGEGIWRLPVCNWCFGEPEDSPPVGPLPAESAGFVTFGSFNNFAKVSPAIMDLWARILLAIPNSRLLLKYRGLSEKSIRRRIEADFAHRGISAERLQIRGHEIEASAHLAAYNEMDIALDTFPYHGTTTTCEALWMGVPVITLAGATHISRVGISLLTNAGLPELIAQTPERYVEITATLAKALPRLADLRCNLRQKMRTSPLMDGPRFARDFESACREMWRKWCLTPPR